MWDPRDIGLSFLDPYQTHGVDISGKQKKKNQAVRVGETD